MAGPTGQLVCTGYGRDVAERARVHVRDQRFLAALVRMTAGAGRLDVGRAAVITMMERRVRDRHLRGPVVRVTAGCRACLARHGAEPARKCGTTVTAGA